MPQVNCKICNKEFYAKPNWLLKGFGKYCSHACKRIAQRTGSYKECFICKKKTWKTPKDVRTSKSKLFFCSKTCQTIWRNKIVFVGANHANWKGGHFVYRETMKRTKIPQVCKRCLMKDKRVLIVHHVDKNRSNNHISNLVWLCANCHMLIHHDINEMKIFMEAIV